MKQTLIAIISIFCCTTCVAQDKTAGIDKIFSWTTPTTPGCVCAVSQNGKLIANRAYGSADLERNVPIDVNSVFDIGSLHKQFVAAAALILVEDGTISFTDNIRKYIPELPEYANNVTINHLMTHTSGIRDWSAMLPLSGSKPDVLTLILRQRQTDFKPGEEWNYTSSGFVLLKEIIARVSKMSFGEFAQKRMFDKLGMKSTLYSDDTRAVVKNRALAYDKAGQGWRMAMLMDNNRGGGGVLSTAGDLLIWNDAITNGGLSKFVSEKMQEQTVLNNGRKLNYGRGLILDTYRGTKEIWHSGSADGYKSFLGRYPEYGISIAIMCNSGDGTDRIQFAHRIFHLLTPDFAGKEFDPAPPPLEGVDPNTLAGLYFNDAGQALRLAAQNGRLRVAEGPGLKQISKDRYQRWGASVFFMSQDEFEIQFLSTDELELKSMEGKITKYRRAKTYTPSETDLKAFAGNYESDELGSLMHIIPSKTALEGRLEHVGKNMPLTPVAPDIFQVSRVFVRFIRDKAGKVVGFELTNPLIRNVKYSRVNDVAGRR